MQQKSEQLLLLSLQSAFWLGKWYCAKPAKQTKIIKHYANCHIVSAAS